MPGLGEDVLLYHSEYASVDEHHNAKREHTCARPGVESHGPTVERCDGTLHNVILPLGFINDEVLSSR